MQPEVLLGEDPARRVPVALGECWLWWRMQVRSAVIPAAGMGTRFYPHIGYLIIVKIRGQEMTEAARNGQKEVHL